MYKYRMRCQLTRARLLTPIGALTHSQNDRSSGWPLTIHADRRMDDHRGTRLSPRGPAGPALSEIAAGNPTPPSHVTLRFVSWKADHPRAWDEALAKFAASHPHISVVREIAPHSSTAYHDLLTQKLKNHDATVDLFFMDIIWVPEFASAGWALDTRRSVSSR